MPFAHLPPTDTRTLDSVLFGGVLNCCCSSIIGDLVRKFVHLCNKVCTLFRGHSLKLRS